MTPETVLTIGQQTLELIIVLVSVVLIPALITGLLVSMFQAATQISEATLSFIPKLIVTFVTIMIAGPWMLRVLMDYTRRLIENIPFMIL
ncbi:MAG: flagellar biosynthesis protein FliQ [Gammaproteobacteria bacterium]|nr:MAG: flagellar biosynthesis protein FliQ [Gammaproteobacteria bacterium]